MNYADDMLMTKSNKEIFSKRLNSKINDLIWPVFKLARDYIYVHLSCKFLEVPIKTEQVMVMIFSLTEALSVMKGM